MSLRFHYKLVPTGYSVLTLGGRFVRPRPIVPITVFGPAGSYSVRAFLDPGSDETVFEEGLAAAIGVDLNNASVGRATGIGLVGSVLRYAQVSMQITDGTELRVWNAWVGFTATRLVYPILGFAGFLQFFDAHFFGGREEVELVVNGLFPGT